MAKRRIETIKGFLYPNEKIVKRVLVDEVLRRYKEKGAELGTPHQVLLEELANTNDSNFLDEMEAKFESDKSFYYKYLYGRNILKLNIMFD